MSYKQFIEGKMQYGANSGFEPLWMPDFLFDFQKFFVEYAVNKGRCAVFADCGLGKTPIYLTWAQNIIMKHNKPVLVLAPLAVVTQVIEEGEKFGIEAEKAVPGQKPNKAGIYVTNYEKLHHFKPSWYIGIVCDESSILKNKTGIRSKQVTEFMRTIKYRLLCTATAAPNDWEELGTSSEALGYLGNQDMLTKFFKRSQIYARESATRKEYVLRGHAAKGPFWQWVASWARAARMPSDLGFDDNGFVLPGLVENDIEVRATSPTNGMMFDMEARNFHEENEAIKRTIRERCEKAAEIIMSHSDHAIAWVNRNEEGDLLEKLIPGSVQVAGRHSDSHKIDAARWFKNGSDSKKTLITKAEIFGFGLNFQNCHRMVYFPSHSYERYYQALSRLHRFGQANIVAVDRVYTRGTKRLIKNMTAKANEAQIMFDMLVRFMDDSLTVDKTYIPQEVKIPLWISR